MLGFVHTATRFRKSRHARLAQSTRAETAHARFVADLPAGVFATRREREQLQDECLGYCGAMLAIRTTLPHFSDSAAMKAANSWALSGIGTVPKSASRAPIVGSASTAPISRSRRAITAAGVPLGAPTPAQVLASYPGNASAIVGTSGSASKRRLPATASARSAPVRTCGSEVTITSKPVVPWSGDRWVIRGAAPG